MTDTQEHHPPSPDDALARAASRLLRADTVEQWQRRFMELDAPSRAKLYAWFKWKNSLYQRPTENTLFSMMHRLSDADKQELESDLALGSARLPSDIAYPFLSPAFDENNPFVPPNLLKSHALGDIITLEAVPYTQDPSGTSVVFLYHGLPVAFDSKFDAEIIKKDPSLFSDYSRYLNGWRDGETSKTVQLQVTDKSDFWHAARLMDNPRSEVYTTILYPNKPYDADFLSRRLPRDTVRKIFDRELPFGEWEIAFWELPDTHRARLQRSLGAQQSGAEALDAREIRDGLLRLSEEDATYAFINAAILLPGLGKCGIVRITDAKSLDAAAQSWWDHTFEHPPLQCDVPELTAPLTPAGKPATAKRER